MEIGRTRFLREDDAVGDERELAAGFVGAEAVVADGLTPLRSVHAVWLRSKQSRDRDGALLALGWDVEKSGGDDCGSLIDLGRRLKT